MSGREDDPIVDEDGLIGVIGEGPAERSTSTDSVVLPERLLRRLLKEGFDFLVKQSPEAVDYISYFFDATVLEKEKNQFLARLSEHPPNVTLGYPRITSEFPIITILTAADNEEQNYLGDLGRETDEYDDEGTAGLHNVGHWNATYSILVIDQHPDYTLMLYAITKSLVLAGADFLMANGVLQLGALSGGEMQPSLEYQAENIFSRTLNVPMVVPVSVPRLLKFDPANGKIHVFNEDARVYGLKGRVTGDYQEDE